MALAMMIPHQVSGASPGGRSKVSKALSGSSSVLHQESQPESGHREEYPRFSNDSFVL